MMVKICGITNLEDAIAAAEFGASAIGFNFYAKSPRYIEPERAASVSHQIPQTVLKVGVFVNEDAGTIVRVAKIVGLDVVQLHGDETASETARLPFRTWKAFRATTAFNPGILDDYPSEAFLLDAPSGALYGGTGQSFDWKRAAAIPHRLILAGGLDADCVADAIEQVRPWGVDVCSRLENAPGKKNHLKMRQFLRAALDVQTGKQL